MSLTAPTTVKMGMSMREFQSKHYMFLSVLLVVQAALLQADGGALTSEMLNPLSRAIPEPKEAADIRLFLQVRSDTALGGSSFCFIPDAGLSHSCMRVLLQQR